MTCPCFFLTERQRLGRELLKACERLDWQEAISLVEKGEYTRAERHLVHTRISSSAECRSSLREHRWTHSSLFRKVAPTLQHSSVFIELLHPGLVVGHSGWTHKSSWQR